MYEQSLCHRSAEGLQGHEEYCRGYFLPRYGRYNDTSTHRAFAREYCAETATRSLSLANGIDSALTFVQQNLAFFGLTEYFDESICLFLYQSGRFVRNLCTCAAGTRDDGARPGLSIRRELPQISPIETEYSQQGAIGVPPLRLTKAELDEQSPNDLKLHWQLVDTFKQRVRSLERAVDAKVWGCRSIEE